MPGNNPFSKTNMFHPRVHIHSGGRSLAALGFPKTELQEMDPKEFIRTCLREPFEQDRLLHCHLQDVLDTLVGYGRMERERLVKDKVHESLSLLMQEDYISNFRILPVKGDDIELEITVTSVAHKSNFNICPTTMCAESFQNEDTKQPKLNEASTEEANMTRPSGEWKITR